MNMHFVTDVIEVHLFFTANIDVCVVDGYCRSDGILAVFIQKKEAANRIHATLVNSQTSADGYKEQGNCVHIFAEMKINAELYVQNTCVVIFNQISQSPDVNE